MLKIILNSFIILNLFVVKAQDNLEVIAKFNYLTTTQFDGTKRTSKYVSALVTVNNSNNFIVVDEGIKVSKSAIYLNNTQREEEKINGQMIIHYDSPKFGKNQIAYLDDSSLILILPNNQKLIFSAHKPTNTTMVD